MKKTLLILSLVVNFSAFSQITVFEDNFDSYTDFVISGFGSWQTLDLDLLETYVGGGPASDPAWEATWPNAGAPQAYMVFNPVAATVVNATTGIGGETENRNFDPRSGAKYMACWGGVPSSNGQTATANNDWLVSPVINLAGATGSSLSVWVKSMSDTYGLEKYRIGVYVGTGTPTLASDFNIISGIPNLSAPYPNWFERTQSLSAYDGQNIRIGIQCRSADIYMLMVDDFKITATTLSRESFLTSKFSVYPNPVADVITISNSENIEIAKITFTDINGRIVKNVAGNQNQINISDLESGVYFMKLESVKGTVLKKIIKE